MEPNIGLDPEFRNRAIEILQRQLADHFVLAAKVRNYHWNVEGSSFNDLHKFFEGLYDQLDAAIDGLAERIRALGGKSPGTLTEFQQLTRLKEYPAFYPGWHDMVQDLLKWTEAISTNLREEIPHLNDQYKDFVTGDYFTGLLAAHEKNAWMLRSLLA